MSVVLNVVSSLEKITVTVEDLKVLGYVYC